MSFSVSIYKHSLFYFLHTNVNLLSTPYCTLRNGYGDKFYIIIQIFFKIYTF